tara:strand:+ start:729 stop:1352 length:624 start_codon:yes stop_codon:yes gene_type:complete
MAKKYRIKKSRINKKTKKNYRKGGTRRSSRTSKQPERFEPDALSVKIKKTKKIKTTKKNSPTNRNKSKTRNSSIEKRRDTNMSDPMLGFTKQEFINYYGEKEGNKLWDLNKKPFSIYQLRNAEMNRNQNTGYHYQPTSVFFRRYNQNTGEYENVYYNQYEMDSNRANDNILREWLKYNRLPYPRNVRQHQEYLRQALYEYRHRNVRI